MRGGVTMLNNTKIRGQEVNRVDLSLVCSGVILILFCPDFVRG